MNGLGTIGSIVQQIVDDMHMPIGDVVRRKVVQTMRFHRDKRYFFSDRIHRLNLKSGKYEYRPGDGYGLPADLVEIQGQVIWILMSGSEDQRQPCIRVTSPEWDRSRADWGTSSSQPEEWEFRTNALRFSPTPSSDDDVAEIRYLTSTLIPRMNYENGAYAYYHPTTGQALTINDVDEWSNDWTTQDGGQAAIMHRTRYDLQKTYLRDYEAAQESLTNWLEVIAQLESETEAKAGQVTYLSGSMFGGGDDLW